MDLAPYEIYEGKQNFSQDEILRRIFCHKISFSENTLVDTLVDTLRDRYGYSSVQCYRAVINTINTRISSENDIEAVLQASVRSDG